MAIVKEIREELDFNNELSALLNVMKSIAVFQFHALQRKKERFAKFFQSLSDFFRIVDLGRAPNIFLNSQTDKSGIVMITSDEGFMGSLNFQVINRAIIRQDKAGAELIIVGERGARYLDEMNKEHISFKSAADLGGRYALSMELADYIMEGVKTGRFGRVIVAYPNPVSFMIQQVKIEQILPMAADFSGAYSAAAGQKEPITVESHLADIVEYLAGELLVQKLNEVLEDSKLSEFAARALHLERSGQELTERKRYLKLRYFRAHHERTDKSIRELFSSQIIRHRESARKVGVRVNECAG